MTGFVPAQIAQLNYLDSRLRLFEVASVLVIMALVAFAFRSLLAPLVVVGVAAVGYLVYFPLLSSFAAAWGFTVPAQLEPVLVALLLGVVTDYCVLLFSAFRDELRGGLDRKEAAQAALRVNARIIAWAGLTVAGGTIALLAAPFQVFRGLGPALALTVLVGLAVCLTLAPAVMTILGWRLFTVVPVRGSQSRNGFLRAAPAQTSWAGAADAARVGAACCHRCRRRPRAGGRAAYSCPAGPILCCRPAGRRQRRRRR